MVEPPATPSAPPPATARSERSARTIADPGWRAVAAAFAFNGALFGAWASRVPAFKTGFGLDAGQLGLVLLALAAGAIASFPVAGALCDRLGPDRVTGATVLAYGPALVLIGFAPNAMNLALALAVFGALHGAMDVAMNGWGAKVEKRLDRPLMSRFHALFSLGAGVGAGTGFLAAHEGFVPVVHFAAAACAFGLPALLMLARASAQRPRAASTSPPARDDGAPMVVLPRGPLLLVGLIAFGVSMGEGAMADWSAVFLHDVNAASEGAAALGYVAFSATMVGTRLAGDAVTARLGPVTTVRLSGLVASVGVTVIVASATPSVSPAASLITALVGFGLVGVGYAVVMPLVFSRAARDPHTAPGTAIAAVATLGYGGMLLGPAAVGFAAHATTLATAFAMLGVLALLSALLAARLR